MLFSGRFSATVLLCLFLGAPVQAQAICGPALAACDLQTDMACLEKTYACGQYDTIIQTLYAEDFGLIADQKYYLGAAFYGRHVRERATGAQCGMVREARDKLTDYLMGVDAEFTASGSFGSLRQMDQIYHANQMMSDLGEIAGCVESALTRARIDAVARSEGVRFARAVFLSPPSEARDAFGTLQLALRGFVSKASDLETGIALRRVEIRSARSHLTAIRAIFANVFGPVSGAGATIAINTAILDGLQVKTQAMLRSVEVEEAEFKAALGGVTPEAYAAIRAETVGNADRFLKESSFHINMIGILLPTDPARPFWKLADDLAAPNSARLAFDNLATIRADWKAHGTATGICAQPGAATRVWYCR